MKTESVLLVISVIALLLSAAESCKINALLQGTFHKQPTGNAITTSELRQRSSVAYEQVVITSTSVSSWGDCYENFGNSYVFGLKRTGDSYCFRCVTMIIRAPNVIQAAHEINDSCRESIEEVRSTCFDENLISPSEGIFLYRSTFIEAPSCGLDGQFSVSFHKPFSNVTCSGFDSSMNNCQFTSQMDFEFHNCSFPDFQMHLNCIGKWKGRSSEQYMAIEDQETGEIRCAMLMRLSPEKLVVYMSNDAQCAGLSPNGTFPADTYRFRQTNTNVLNIEENSRRNLAICHFPEWLQGRYNEITISGDILNYTPNSLQSSSAVSYCIDVDEDRVAVFSETLCEEVVGFHCFQFRTRSSSVIEFKTTDRYDSYKPDLCRNDRLFEYSSWTTMVSTSPDAVSCGYAGIFETSAKEQGAECYRMTVDCKHDYIMRISAYDCSSGTIHDTRSYECLAVWKESENLFVYTQQISERQNNCFITRMIGGRLLMSSSGVHCQRNYNFTLNNEKTLSLEQKAKCAENVKEVIVSTDMDESQVTHNMRANHGEISINTNANDRSSSNRRKSPVSRTTSQQSFIPTNSSSVQYISALLSLITLSVLYHKN